MVPRVLMFGWEFPPHKSGGLGTACLGLVRALSKENVDVTFVLPRKIEVTPTDSNVVFADEDSLKSSFKSVSFRAIDTILAPYVTSESYRDSNGIERVPLVPDHYGTSLMDEVKRYALRARAVALKEDFDVIHAHDWLSFLAGLEAKRATGKPLVIHVHATEFDRGGGNGVNQAVYDIERYVMGEADRIITVSNWTREIIIKNYGADPNKIDVVHNGIELDEVVPTNIDFSELKKDGNKLVLFLGRITIQKGPEYFVEAAKKALQFYPKITFIVSGSGDMENQMIQQVADAGMSDKFIFTGFLAGEEISAAYKNADLFIMPSVSEPFGITPLESIVHGTPVIISRQSGVSEVIDHVLKVDFWDVDDIANKIVCSLQYDSLPETLIKNSQNEVKEVNWGAAAGKCVAVYNKLLKSIKK